MRGSRLVFATSLIISALLLVVMLPGPLQPRAGTEQVNIGREVWRTYDCEGCHTLYGQGGAYAPDLTHSFSQRGETYLREFLVNPAAFHPEQRQMPAFGLTRSETDAVLAFLEWIGTQDAAQNWPPNPILVSGRIPESGLSGNVAGSSAATSANPAERGRYWFSQPPAICSTCHSLTPDVVIVGPSLAGIGSRAAERVPGLSAEAYLRQSIIQPDVYIVPGFQDVMQKNFGSALSAETINDLIAFLMTLQ